MRFHLPFETLNVFFPRLFNQTFDVLTLIDS